MLMVVVGSLKLILLALNQMWLEWCSSFWSKAYYFRFCLLSALYLDTLKHTFHWFLPIFGWFSPASVCLFSLAVSVAALSYSLICNFLSAISCLNSVIPGKYDSHLPLVASRLARMRFFHIGCYFFFENLELNSFRHLKIAATLALLLTAPTLSSTQNLLFSCHRTDLQNFVCQNFCFALMCLLLFVCEFCFQTRDIGSLL